MSEGEPNNGGQKYELMERAMTLWTWGEQMLQRMPWMDPEHAARYETAIARGLERLRLLGSMQELVEAYFAPWEAEQEPGERAVWGHGWVLEVCKEVGDRSMSWTIVEDATYFRRSRELIIQAVGEG